MKKQLVALAVSALFAGVATHAMADPIPYPGSGTYNDDTYTFYASGDGPITAYFYFADAGYDNTIGLLVNGVSTGTFGLDDHSSTLGESLVLGNVLTNDVLTFVLKTNGGASVYSNPLMNTSYDSSTATGYDPLTGVSNGHNHVYSTDFTGAGTIPAGTYIAFEDQSFPASDYDYNDETFVVTGVANTITQSLPPVLIGTPEPATWAMMLMGVAAVGAGLRMSRSRRVDLTAA